MDRLASFAHAADASVLLAGWLGLGAFGSAVAEEQKRSSGSTTGASEAMHSLEFGVRSGFGFNRPNTPEFGRFAQMVPIWVDLGYRTNPNWYLGLYFEYGIALSFDVCTGRFFTRVNPSILLCSGKDLRFGGNAHYHFRPNRKVDPWLGAGVGFELAPWQQSASRAGYEDYSGTLTGFELVNLQLGLDYRDQEPAVHIGPFVAITLAFDSSSKFHSWLVVGARLVFDVRLH